MVGVGYWTISDTGPAIILPEIRRWASRLTQHDSFIPRTIVGPHRRGVLRAKRHT